MKTYVLYLPAYKQTTMIKVNQMMAMMMMQKYSAARLPV